MKHFSSLLTLSLLLSLPVHLQATSACCSDLNRSPENSFVEAVSDKYDCALVTVKIRKPSSEQEWIIILELLQELVNQHMQKGQTVCPTKMLKDLDAVLEEIFASDDVHGEISIEFALEKCPCENKAKCGENCDCGALECKEMQVTKETCCS